MRGTILRTLVSTRSVIVLFGAMLIAIALVALAIGVATKKADAATTVVTKTFNKPAQILIPDGQNLNSCANGITSGVAHPYPSTRRVTSFNQGEILDVNLTLRNYTHTFPDDVDVLLAHRGINRTVMSDAGGAFDVNDINLTLDQEATTLMPDETQLEGGRVRPNNFDGLDSFPDLPFSENGFAALTGFDGANPNGTWRLYVQDDSGGDCGEFGGGWTLRIKARVTV